MVDSRVNHPTKTATDRFSTFLANVDVASYTMARKRLENGDLPQTNTVRVEEFVNYFSYNYPSPDEGAFGVHIEGAPSPFNADKHLLRIGVQGKRVSPAERIPVHLTFLINISDSTVARAPLSLVKQSLTLLTNSLREGDTLAFATYVGRTENILEPTGMEDRAKILDAIDKLGADIDPPMSNATKVTSEIATSTVTQHRENMVVIIGDSAPFDDRAHLRPPSGTAMFARMEIAYEMAMSAFKEGHENRVLVINGGPSGTATYQRVHQFVEEGITLSTIADGGAHTTMEQLANRGNGNFYYIDSFEEAQKVFESQVGSTLQVIAKDVTIQVEFDPVAIPEYRLIGYDNRPITDENFCNDRGDAGDIGAGHTVTAMYEVQLNPGAEGTLATVRIGAKKPDGSDAAEQEFHLRDTDIVARVGDASTDFQFAAAVSTFAEVLRFSPYASLVEFDQIKEVAQPAVGDRAERREFMALIDRAETAFARKAAQNVKF